MRDIRFRVWDIKMKTYSGNWYALNCLQASAKEKDFTNIKELKIIEQYTGLNDKNGVEIYEGDTWKGPMDYGPGGMSETIVPIPSLEAFFKQFGYGDWEQGEVIGNIHQEPKA